MASNDISLSECQWLLMIFLCLNVWYSVVMLAGRVLTTCFSAWCWSGVTEGGVVCAGRWWSGVTEGGVVCAGRWWSGVTEGGVVCGCVLAGGGQV